MFSYTDPGTGDVVSQDVKQALSISKGERPLTPKRVLIHKRDVKDSEGKQINFDSYSFSPDMRYALLTTDRQKVSFPLHRVKLRILCHRRRDRAKV